MMEAPQKARHHTKIFSPMTQMQFDALTKLMQLSSSSIKEALRLCLMEEKTSVEAEKLLNDGTGFRAIIRARNRAEEIMELCKVLSDYQNHYEPEEPEDYNEEDEE